MVVAAAPSGEAQAEGVLQGIKQDRARAEQQFALMAQEYDRIAVELAAMRRRAEGYRGVWTGSLVRAREPGITEGRDPRTGEVKRTRPKDQEFFQPGKIALTMLGELDGFKIRRNDLIC